ncbi:DsbC family protein [Pseudomonas sp. Irchel 3E13]|uniref:DsbC family protein n=1 Tax=Pseudomonas sp. Irchel 3E13 TaxID=2008975 RepID=UPI0015B01D5A|nr:DsbC family protein [Pseudomonas sp. Irchel 3E13]
MFRRIFFALLASTAATVSAADQADSQHNQTAPMPINGMIAAVKNGKLAFVSDNGRFVFRGSMYDTWSQQEVTTLAEAEQASKYIDLKKLKFNIEDLVPFTVGTGARTVVVFTDPLCPSCALLISDLQKIEGYNFKIVEVPALGNDSAKIVRSLLCAKDKEEAFGIATGKSKPRVVDQRGNDCDTSPIGKRIISAQMFGVKGVPFMIRDDGLIKHGYEKGTLSNWLAGAK